MSVITLSVTFLIAHDIVALTAMQYRTIHSDNPYLAPGMPASWLASEQEQSSPSKSEREAVKFGEVEMLETFLGTHTLRNTLSDGEDES